jgi:MFS family permease
MAVFGTSSVLGPVIGGFLAGQSSLLGITGWRWIFYVNVPLGILAFVVVMRVLHLPHTRREHRIDWPGALALVITLVPLLIVAEQGRTWGWDSGRAVLCYVIGLVGLIAFIFAERAYQDDALLPLRLFKNRSFAVGSVGSIVLGAGMFGGILLLPQYLQIVHGSSPTVAGLQMIPLVGGIMTGAMGSGIAIGKTGRYKIFPLVGIVFIVAALVSMSFIIDADTSVWSLVPFMILLGVGLGFNFQPVILAVQNAVSPREMGVATSSVTFFRQMGGTIGVAAFLSILFTTLPARSPCVDRRGQPTPGSRGAVSGQLQAGERPVRHVVHPELPEFLATPFKTGSPTRSTWCSSSRRRSWRSASSSCCSCRSSRSATSRDPGLQEDEARSRPRHRRRGGRSGPSAPRHPRRPPRRSGSRAATAPLIDSQHLRGCLSDRRGGPRSRTVARVASLILSRRDLDFLLHEWLDVESLTKRARGSPSTPARRSTPSSTSPSRSPPTTSRRTTGRPTRTSPGSSTAGSR